MTCFFTHAPFLYISDARRKPGEFRVAGYDPETGKHNGEAQEGDDPLEKSIADIQVRRGCHCCVGSSPIEALSFLLACLYLRVLCSLFASFFDRSSSVRTHHAHPWLTLVAS